MGKKSVQLETSVMTVKGMGVNGNMNITEVTVIKGRWGLIKMIGADIARCTYMIENISS
jgi:hypothetical protein